MKTLVGLRIRLLFLNSIFCKTFNIFLSPAHTKTIKISEEIRS